MSAFNKLEITIADRLHDFTDKERMPSTANKQNIVTYIQKLLIDLLKDKIKEIKNIRSYGTFADTVSNLSEDKIVGNYYIDINRKKGSIIETIDDLYKKEITEFLYNQDITTNTSLIFSKNLFKYVPQWLYSLYGQEKSFMMDVTLLTEKDICTGIRPPKDNLILKSIATEYDRNVENKTIENCSSLYSPEPDSTLLTKTENELLGFDSIHYINDKQLEWRMKDEKKIIHIDTLISIKSAASKKNTDDSSMGLPLFLKFIERILTTYVTDKDKKNNFKDLDKKIKELYGLSFEKFDGDYDRYVLCLTDLKSMGDLLQVKMAQLSNSIFVSNDRVTCLMSSICYNNPTIRTRKIDPDKKVGSPSTTLREIYLFDESNILLSPETKKKLEDANNIRIAQEEEIKKKKINFIELLKTFLNETYIDILQGVKDALILTVRAYETEIKSATQTILTEQSKKRKREELYYFNYDIYQYRIILILLNYYLGFLNCLIYTYTHKGDIDITLYDNFINYDIDSPVKEQEEYISLSLTLLYSNLRDLIYYIIPENIRKKRLDKDLVDEIPLFNYPASDIIKCSKDLHVFNIRSQLKYMSIKIENVSYQVGFSYSEETLKKFNSTILELQDMSEEYLETINNSIISGGRPTSRKTKYNTKKSRTRNTTLNRTKQKRTTRYTYGSKFFNTPIMQQSFTKELPNSTNLIYAVIEFLINYLTTLDRENKKYTRKWQSIITSKKSKFTVQETNNFLTQFNSIKSDYQFTRLLLFQILFIVHIYDLALPIDQQNLKTVNRNAPSRLESPPIFNLGTELNDKLLSQVYKYKKYIKNASPSPMDISGGSNKQFQFSQQFISQLVNRLTL